VASERKIAANRRNARKSTGPRSSAGKQRTRRNSYRHGFSASVTSSAERTKRIEKLARRIAGNSTDVIILECARDVAQAELDLAQIRRVKVAIIERILAFGEIQAPQASKSVGQIKQYLNALDRRRVIDQIPVEGDATLPLAEPERLAEAVRRALPELLKLDRYERHAAVLRDRSIRIIKGRRNNKNNH
jgi:hypothetical protein